MLLGLAVLYSSLAAGGGRAESAYETIDVCF